LRQKTSENSSMKNMLEHIGPDLELSKKLVTDPE
jgi:hypothetical protein